MWLIFFIHIFCFLKNITWILPLLIPNNDEEVTDDVNEFTIWKQFLPNPVQPGKTTDVMVKLATPLSQLIKIEVADKMGNRYSRVIQPVPPELRISYIGFGDEYKTVYVWVNNSGKEKLKIKSIFLDDNDISSFTKLSSIKPNSKHCYKIKLKESLKQGEYISIKINSEDDVLSESLIRVFSYFPITSWDGDTREKYGFDSRTLLMGPLKDDKEFEKCKETPWYKIYHVFNDPACEDSKKEKPLGGHAKEIIQENERYRKFDSIHPTSIYLCENQKPFNYFIYGELADVIMVNPYEVAFYGNKPEKDGEFVKLAKLASEPRLLYAIVEAFKDSNEIRKIHRFPTYE
ncbi:MAG: hypothetical protein ACD_79C00239G0004, partial [uncultured bacterium]